MYRVSPGSGSTVGTPAELVGASSSRCLDVNGASTTPGTQVDIWDCDGGANQKWTPTAAA